MIFAVLLILLLGFLMFAGVGLAQRSRVGESPPRALRPVSEVVIKRQTHNVKCLTMSGVTRTWNPLEMLPEIPGNGLAAGGLAA